MTISVKQAGAALPERAKADAPRQNGKDGETGFAEAVKFGAPGKQTRPSTTEAADARRQWELPVGHRDADGRIDPKAESAEQQEAPGERTATASDTMPIGFRPPLPPMVLLGFGRPEAGAASDGDLTSPTALASLQAGRASSPPSDPNKPGAVPVKAAAVAQLAADRWTKAAAKESEAKPVPASLGDLAIKPPAGAQSGAASTNETPKPAAAESATRLDVTTASTTIARDSLRKNAPDAPIQPGRVTVLAQQNIPAPAVPAMTAAPLLTAIAADGSWRELAATADLRLSADQNAVASTHSLKVQLHPAELGVVTASLRFAGDQLTIELQVESIEAQQRLSADSDAIVKSLRALGLEVDRVTIQQSAVVQAPNTRADTNAGQNGQQASDRQSFNAANSGGGNGQAAGQQSGRSTSNGAQASQNVASGAVDRTGGGLYI
jgi:chemotaxis protein MotD